MKMITNAIISIGIGLFFVLIWSLFSAGIIVIGGVILALIIFYSNEIIKEMHNLND